MPGKQSRRNFLKKSALAAGAVGVPMFIPATALGRDGKVPPSQRLVLGFIGVGGMGNGHLGHFLGESRVSIAAVCDVYGKHLNDSKNRVGEHCAAYKDYRDLLERDDIDAVVISTPDQWHTLTSLHAMQAGKDVYCEKPLTLFVKEGRVLADAARRYGRVFQVGSQQRSDTRFRHACELAINNKLGTLRRVETNVGWGPLSGFEPDSDPPPDLDWDMWLGPAPWAPYNRLRCIYNFRWFMEYSGGKMTDWGAHHNDIAQWGTGHSLTGPRYVEGRGSYPKSGLYNTLHWYDIDYTYDNGVVLNCSVSNRGGVKFIGDDAWVYVDRGTIDSSDPDLLSLQFGAGDTRLYVSHEHHTDWLDCIETREKPITDVEIGHRSVTVCHLGNIACKLGRKLEWDPEKEEFVNDPEANRYLEKPYRAPWHLT